MPFLNGVLHLSWSGQPPLTPSHEGELAHLPPTGVIAAHPVIEAGGNNRPEVGVDDSEQLLSTAINTVPAAQREQVKQARVLPGTKAVAVHPLPPTGPVKMMTEAPKVLRVEKLHAINGGAAQQKQARDAAQIKALCVATNNAPTGLPASVCATAASPATH